MSSLVFLGLSTIVFIITYGIVFLLVPQILGHFFTVLDNYNLTSTMSASWQSIYTQNENTTKFLVPLIPSIGVFLLVLKVLMAASVKGSD